MSKTKAAAVALAMQIAASMRPRPGHAIVVRTVRPAPGADPEVHITEERVHADDS